MIVGGARTPEEVVCLAVGPFAVRVMNLRPGRIRRWAQKCLGHKAVNTELLLMVLGVLEFDPPLILALLLLAVTFGNQFAVIVVDNMTLPVDGVSGALDKA